MASASSPASPRPTPGVHAPVAPPVVTYDARGVDAGAASLDATANAVANLRTTRDALAEEERSAKLRHGSARLELESLRDELGRVRAQLASDRDTLAVFARGCAPVLRMHELNLAELRRVHSNACDGHARGVVVLKKEFGVRRDGVARRRHTHYGPARAARSRPRPLPPSAPLQYTEHFRADKHEQRWESPRRGPDGSAITTRGMVLSDEAFRAGAFRPKKIRE